MGRLAVVVSVLFLGVVPPCRSAHAADGPAPPPAVAGPDAWTRMVGNTIRGTTADGPFTEYFDPRGSVRHLDRNGRDEGHWTLRGDLLCLVFPGDDEEDCRRPEVAGAQGAFVDSDGSRYPFSIVPGNPEGL